MRIFAKLTKVDVEKREVWGRAVQEVPDKANEIFDYETSKPLFQAWSADFEKVTDGKSLGNIRAMHGKVAAGKVIAIDFNDADKAIDIGTKIVDDAEWQKCLEGVYTGFSIGGSYVKKWKDAAVATLTRYTAQPSETSLVDNPCVGTAVFSIVKSATETEEKAFQKCGLLKAVIDKDDLTVGELLFLTKEYLPAEEVESLQKSANPFGDFRDKLRALVADTPVEAVVEKVAEAPAASETSVVVEDKKIEAAVATETPAAKVFKHLRKGMYSVQSFAGILQSLAWLAQDAEAEKGWENDASSVPADLRTAVQLLCEIFKKMSAEETDEMIASIIPEGTVIEVIELAANGDMAKAGKRHSEKDQKMVQAIHDTAANLGADCGAEKVAKADGPTLELIIGDSLTDLGKAFAAATGAPPTANTVTDEQVALIAKHAVTVIGENDELKKRIALLEKQPAPGKGVVRVTVTKTDDGDPIEKVEAPKPDPANPLEVMKKVHAQGGRAIRL